MGKFILRRTLMVFPMLLGISLLSFLIMHMAPGDPATLNAAMRTNVDPSYIEKLHEFYGLNDPLYLQYWHWLKRLCVLDFGMSFRDNRPALEVILERIPATLYLSGLSLLLLFLIAVPLGVVSAYYQDRFFDRFASVVTFIGYSAPHYWVALLLMLLFGVRLNWLPVSGLADGNADLLPWYSRIVDLLAHLVLPLAVTTYGGVAAVSRYARTSMLEVIRQDYIRTARAKGLNEFQVVFRHALPNALIPVVTLMGLFLPSILGGSVIIETIFSWPGMGRLYWESIVSHNYTLVMGVGILLAFMTLLGNLLADIAYAVLDPRIRYD